MAAEMSGKSCILRGEDAKPGDFPETLRKHIEEMDRTAPPRPPLDLNCLRRQMVAIMSHLREKGFVAREKE